MSRRRLSCSEARIIRHRKFKGKNGERVLLRSAGWRRIYFPHQAGRNPVDVVFVPGVDVTGTPMGVHDAPGLEIIESGIEMRVVIGLFIEIPETEIVPELVRPSLPTLSAGPDHEAPVELITEDVSIRTRHSDVEVTTAGAGSFSRNSAYHLVDEQDHVGLEIF